MSTQLPVLKNTAKNRAADDHAGSVLDTSGVVLDTQPEPLDTPGNINGWTIKKDRRGYYSGYRRIGRKLVTKYIGKTLRRAREILSAELATTSSLPEQTIDIALETRQPSRITAPVQEIMSNHRCVRCLTAEPKHGELHLRFDGNVHVWIMPGSINVQIPGRKRFTVKNPEKLERKLASENPNQKA